MADEGKLSQVAEEPVVLVEKRGNIEIITLNRPKAGNSVNGDLAQALDTALNHAEEDDKVFAVVLTGAGNRVFCAGADVKYMAQNGAAGTKIPGHGFGGLTERYFSKPLICAVNGAAMGGGLEMALVCDLIVAAEHAKFGFPEVKLGIIAAGGGPIRIMRSLNRAMAMELLLTGEGISAERAKEIGLINRAVPAEALMDTAIGLAEKIAENAPLAIRGTKELACKSVDMEVEEAFELSNTIRDRVRASEDTKEGSLAFREKRAPVWKNR